MARLRMRTWILAFGASVALTGCALGTNGSGDDDDDDDRPVRVDAATVDAPVTIPIDAPVAPIDAPSIPIDAPVSLPDAGGGGLLCTTTAECGAGNCCFTLLGVCVPGTEPLPGLCLPQ